MAERRAVSWIPLVGALVVGAALAAVTGWQLNVQTLEHRITDKRSALKKLTLSGGIPPNQEVMDYLTARGAVLAQRYRHWVKAAAAQLPSADTANSPLYFQERFHETQRTLERLASARSLTAPDLLGFPKELPPSDTVPRLLVQLSLIQELAESIFQQGVSALASFKIEDPEVVSEEGGEGTFLTRLPVRVRFTSSLSQYMKILGALERVRPLIDLQGLHVGAAADSDNVDVELLLSRYFLTTAPPGADLAQDLSEATEHSAGPVTPEHTRDGDTQESASAPTRAPHHPQQRN